MQKNKLNKFFILKISGWLKVIRSLSKRGPCLNSSCGFTPLENFNKVKGTSQTGFTLAELMVAALVLVTILVGLLSTYVTCFDLNETNSNMTLALNAAEEKMAEIRDYSFRNACAKFQDEVDGIDVMCECEDGEDPVDCCEGLLRTYVYIDDSDLNGRCSSSEISNDDCNCVYDMLRVVISASWRQKSGRVIGEDQDLDGVLDTDPDEDVNDNNQIDSPVQIVTYMTSGM